MVGLVGGKQRSILRGLAGHEREETVVLRETPVSVLVDAQKSLGHLVGLACGQVVQDLNLLHVRQIVSLTLLQLFGGGVVLVELLQVSLIARVQHESRG